MKNNQLKHNNRLKECHFRLSEKEYVGLKELSKKNGLSVSEYIRYSVGKNNVKVIPMDIKPDFLQTIISSIGAISPIGNNINQLTHAVHLIKNDFQINYVEKCKMLENVLTELMPLLQENSKQIIQLSEIMNNILKAISLT